MTNDRKICVVGLGYVGLPLAVAFGKKTAIVGFDINQKRIDQLKQGIDHTHETSSEDIKAAKIDFTTDPQKIRQCDFIIVAVPTPIDSDNLPDLSPLVSASTIIGQNIKSGSIVVFESTVYPGCTENDCAPIIAKESGLKYPEQFKTGYSPERINPGDKVHTLETTVKVVSGCDQDTLDIVAKTYELICPAGVHRAPTIKVAEAEKIIENVQRAVNIALMNELKMTFDIMGIHWEDVFTAAETKWNFHKYIPGLVGGHCIGVDPYYLSYEAARTGFETKLISAATNINDDMAKYEAHRIIKFLNKRNYHPQDTKILILGGTYKPDVPDIRNSKVENLIRELKSFNYHVDICEPYIDGPLFDTNNVSLDKVGDYNFTVLAVPHKKFSDVKINYKILYNNIDVEKNN